MEQSHHSRNYPTQSRSPLKYKCVQGNVFGREARIHYLKKIMIKIQAEYLKELRYYTNQTMDVIHHHHNQVIVYFSVCVCLSLSSSL